MYIHDFHHSYLSATSRDESWQMYCTSVGKISAEVDQASAPDYGTSSTEAQHHRWKKEKLLNEYQCVYITEGNGTLSCMGTSHKIKSGTIMFLFPGISHHYHPDGSGRWTERWVGFKGNYPDMLLKSGHLSFDMMITDIGLHESLVTLFNQIIDESQKETKGIQQVLSSLTLLLIARIKLISQLDRNFKPHDVEIVERARMIFIDHIYSTLDIESLIEHMSISYKSFRELFKDYTGRTPYQYFLDLKINKAKELLSERSMSIKEISYKLAFDNPYYFSRLFKKKTGVAPSRWNGSVIPTDLDYLE